MRVLKGLLVSLKPRMPPEQENSRLFLSAVSGGKRQRSSVVSSSGFSESPLHWKSSYLEPISGSLQKSIEGVYRIGVFRCQWHVGNARRVYLERIRNRMQKPVEGLSSLHCLPLYKRGL